MRPHISNIGGIILVLLFLPVRALAQGGPPMITDDPDTPGPGYREINLAGLKAKTIRSRSTVSL